MYPKVQSWEYFYLTHICDLFFDVRDLEYPSFEEDATPYTCLPDMIPVLEKLEKGTQGTQSMFDWLSENLLKTIANKWHLIASSKVPIDIQISDFWAYIWIID